MFTTKVMGMVTVLLEYLYLFLNTTLPIVLVLCLILLQLPIMLKIMLVQSADTYHQVLTSVSIFNN